VFNNLKLKVKLILALFVPILGLMYFAFQIAVINHTNKSTITELRLFVNKSIHIANLVHEIQKERGLSSGFIGSNGKKFKVMLDAQRALTDRKILILVNNIKKDKSSNLDKGMKQLNTIYNIRKQIDSMNITFKKNLYLYSIITNDFIDFISNSTLIKSNSSSNSEISKMIISYVNLLKAKEASGLERAILSNVFASGKMNHKVFREFSILHASHQTYINSYKSILTKKQLSYFNSMMNNKSVLEVQRLRELAFSKVEKDKIISDIKEYAGYGGLIHNFKNYVLRGDKKYLINFNTQYKQLNILFERYKNIPTATNKEKAMIDIIYNTFKQYNNGLTKIIKKHRLTQSVKDLDKIVKVDDKPAINAMNILSNNILGANATYWYEVSTKRIEIIKIIKTKFINTMLEKMNKIDEEINNRNIVNIIILIFIVLIIVISSIKIIYNITSSMKKFQKGLIQFFSYLKNSSYDIEPILINSKDEFGQMAVVVNKNIKITKIYLDKKIQEELEKNKKKDIRMFEQSKMASLGEMVANIAHQWRQPLSSISSISSSVHVQVELGLIDNKSLIKDMELILKKTNYLSNTIETFRNFIKNNKEIKEMVLQDIIDESVTIVDLVLSDNNIKLINNIEYDSPINLTLIEGELSQVIINIINNAKDILLENNIQNPWVKLELLKKDSTAIITIEDNAGGIPEDIISKIFEPYFTTKHQSQGTGLGLHMSYKIITESLNGKIYVNNTQNGAKFFIELPL